MRFARAGLLAAFVLEVAVTGTAGAAGVESKPLPFARGASSVTVSGTVEGDRAVDYRVAARAGQTMSVSLKGSNAGNFFKVLLPGSKDVALYSSAAEGNDWTGRLPADGEYRVRVYLSHAAARLGQASSYSLTVALTTGP